MEPGCMKLGGMDDWGWMACLNLIRLLLAYPTRLMLPDENVTSVGSASGIKAVVGCWRVAGCMNLGVGWWVGGYLGCAGMIGLPRWFTSVGERDCDGWIGTRETASGQGYRLR